MYEDIILITFFIFYALCYTNRQHKIIAVGYMNSLIILNSDYKKLVATADTLCDTYKRVVLKYLQTYDKIDLQNIEQFLSLAKEQHSSSTFCVYKQAIKKWIVTNVSDLNVIAKVDMVFKTMKTTTRTKAIQSDEIVDIETVKQMIGKVDIKDQLIIKMLYKSGIRVSELTAIKLKDCEVVNYKNGLCVKILIHGKGSKERYINIDTNLFETIKLIFAGQEYLFESVNGKALSRQFIYKVVNRAGMRVLGTKQVHPHTLRHSFATYLLIEEQKSLKAVSSYLGHASTSITSDYYIHDSLDISDIEAINI